MATLLGGVTTTQAIRAVIGISEESGELPDQYFVDRRMGSALLLELVEWLPSSLSVMQAAADAAVDEYHDDALAWGAIQQASACWCGREIMKSGDLAFFSQSKDNDNMVVRSKFDQDKQVAHLDAQYSRYRSLALKFLGIDAPVTSTTSGLFGAAKPDYDPVANV